MTLRDVIDGDRFHLPEKVINKVRELQPIAQLPTRRGGETVHVERLRSGSALAQMADLVSARISVPLKVAIPTIEQDADNGIVLVVRDQQEVVSWVSCSLSSTNRTSALSA